MIHILALVIACCALALGAFLLWCQRVQADAIKALMERAVPEQMSDRQRIEYARGHIEACRGAELALEGHEDEPHAALMLASARAHTKAVLRALGAAGLALCLVGCGGPRQINPGAAVPASFTTRAHLARLTGADPAAQLTAGAYDRESKAIWIADDLDRIGLLEVWTAEFCHLADDCGSLDAAAALLTGPTFRPVCGDAPAERRAAAAAAIESARAKP